MIARDLFFAFGSILIFAISPSVVAQGEVEPVTSPTDRLFQSYQIFVGPSYLFPIAAYHWPDEHRGVKFGLSAGISLTHRFSDWLEVDGSLSYDRRGFANVVKAYDYFTIAEDVSNDYVTFSLVPTAILLEDRLRVGLGGYVGQMIKSQLTVTYDSLTSTRYAYLKDASRYYKKLDAGIVVSFTYYTKLLNRKAFVRLAGNFGITKIDLLYDLTYVPIASIRRNNALTLSIGLRLTHSR